MNTIVKKKIIEQCEQNPLEEICGIIFVQNGVADLFSCKNLAADPSLDFEISTDDYMECLKRGRPIAIYHSHPANLPQAFSTGDGGDIEGAEELCLPSYLYCLGTKEWLEYIPQSYHESIFDREFVWGFDDCFGAARNYFRENFQIYIKDYDRDETFSSTDSNIILENFEKEGFVMQPPGCLMKHDVILFDSFRAYPQHFGIFQGNSRFFHHPLNCLSRIDMLDGRWQKRIRHILRYHKFT